MAFQNEAMKYNCPNQKCSASRPYFQNIENHCERHALPEPTTEEDFEGKKKPTWKTHTVLRQTGIVKIRAEDWQPIATAENEKNLDYVAMEPARTDMENINITMRGPTRETPNTNSL